MSSIAPPPHTRTHISHSVLYSQQGDPQVGHPRSGLALCPIPPTQVPLGPVCAGEPAGREEVLGRGTIQTLSYLAIRRSFSFVCATSVHDMHVFTILVKIKVPLTEIYLEDFERFGHSMQ